MMRHMIAYIKSLWGNWPHIATWLLQDFTFIFIRFMYVQKYAVGRVSTDFKITLYITSVFQHMWDKGVNSVCNYWGNLKFLLLKGGLADVLLILLACLFTTAFTERFMSHGRHLRSRNVYELLLLNYSYPNKHVATTVFRWSWTKF